MSQLGKVFTQAASIAVRRSIYTQTKQGETAIDQLIEAFCALKGMAADSDKLRYGNILTYLRNARNECRAMTASQQREIERNNEELTENFDFASLFGD